MPAAKPAPETPDLTPAQLVESFRRAFPSVGNTQRPTVVVAPGRVNLIGEHTDYNDGFVCPMAIDKHTTIVCTPRSDKVIRMHSVTSNQTTEFSVESAVPREPPAWSLYPRGVAEALRQKKLLTHGMDALVYSTVPIGGGLSSSASFEIATGLALLTLNDTSMKPMELAMAGVWAEHNYPKMPCGIMDQTISVMGESGHALLLDCRSEAVKQVPLDDPALRIVIANSNVKHELVQGEYTARRHQCEAAVAWLGKKIPGLKSLRDVTLHQLEDSRMGMDPTVYKRAHHVITEIQRTTEFAAALEKRDYERCGMLMVQSHVSLRDDYAVSAPELDTLVDTATGVPGVFGARMTGGGFGGCIVALTTDKVVEPLTQKLLADYKKKHQKIATIFATVASQGAHVVPFDQ